MNKLQIIAELKRSDSQPDEKNYDWLDNQKPIIKFPDLGCELASILDRVDRSGYVNDSGRNKHRHYVWSNVPIGGDELSAYEELENYEDYEDRDDCERYRPYLRLVEQITCDYTEEGLTVVLVEPNGNFESVLTQILTMLPDRIGKSNIDFDLIKVDRFCNSEAQPEIKITKDLSVDIRDRNVLLLQFAIETGCTTAGLLSHLQTQSPTSLKVCTVLNDVSNRTFDIRVDYSVLDLEERAVIGYAKSSEFTFPYISIF